MCSYTLFVRLSLISFVSGKDTIARQVAKLVVEFWPKEPGVYPCTVTLTSDVDIRIYQFEGMRDL